MPWPKELVLVRHAESEGNVLTVDERAQYDIGTHAYGLTPRGVEQARVTGQFLRRAWPNFDVYYTSYYKRSRQTMAIMYPEAKVYEDPRLAEAQRGLWHTMTEAEIKHHLPFEILRRQREDLYHYRPLGGENWPDVELRIHSFLGTLHRDCGDKRVLMVVHGHWLILFQRLIHHFSTEEALERYRQKIVSNASVTVYAAGSGAELDHLVLRESCVPWKSD